MGNWSSLHAAHGRRGLGFYGFLTEIGIIAALSGAIAFLALAIWCLFGVAIVGALTDERKRRVFQYSLAVLLALSVTLLFV